MGGGEECRMGTGGGRSVGGVGGEWGCRGERLEGDSWGAGAGGSEGAGGFGMSRWGGGGGVGVVALWFECRVGRAGGDDGRGGL